MRESNELSAVQLGTGSQKRGLSPLLFYLIFADFPMFLVLMKLRAVALVVAAQGQRDRLDMLPQDAHLNLFW